MFRTAKYAPLFVLITLGACTTMPNGPSVMALPGSGKNFDQFRADDYDCRTYASAQLGATAENASSESGVRSAALGTVLGAAAGAAINGGHGAGVGAGAGLALGGLAGTDAARASGQTVQQRYDMAYLQCMYAKGDQVPMSGHFTGRRRPMASRAAPPPPPPGAPPPPPPDMSGPR